MARLKDFCVEFFYGRSESGARGRYLMLGADMAIVLYFVVTTFLPFEKWMLVTDMVIGVFLTLELAGRILADSNRLSLVSRPLVLLDIAIILSLFLPTVFGNVAFLRVVRAMRLLRSYNVTRQLRGQFGFFARNEEVIFSALNLVVFVFVVAAFVYVLQVGINDDIGDYIDALYYTITTLTTTGFGDVVLIGPHGRLIAILIMVVGVALFVRLVQTIFKPNKVRYECPRCGLMRHDLDAVHCKHCGHELHIRTEGMV